MGFALSTYKTVVIHIITQLELGGAQQNTLYTISHLNRKRFIPYLISGPNGILDREAKKILRDRFIIIDSLKREIQPYQDSKAMRSLKIVIERITFHHPRCQVIIHTHSSKAGILGRLAASFFPQCKVIHSVHGFSFHPYQKLYKQKLYQIFERIVSPQTDFFIMVSQSNRNEGIDLGLCQQKNSMVIRSGIDIATYRFQKESGVAYRKKIGANQDTLIIGTIACLKPQKQPQTFIKLAAKILSRYPSSLFLLAGDGELKQECEQLIKEYQIKDKCIILGWEFNIPSFLSALDIFVLTSKFEGLPRAVLQARASGLPIVATKVNGTPEAITHGENGFLVDPVDLDDMVYHITALIKNTSLREKFSTNAIKNLEEFDIDQMVLQQENLYHSLIHGSK